MANSPQVLQKVLTPLNEIIAALSEIRSLLSASDNDTASSSTQESSASNDVVPDAEDASIGDGDLRTALVGRAEKDGRETVLGILEAVCGEGVDNITKIPDDLGIRQKLLDALNQNS